MMQMASGVESEIPLLVISCDRYADVWQPCFDLLLRHWPDCPFPIYLGSNELSYPDPRVRMIHVGPDRSWAENVLLMLDRLASEYVVLFLEDFFLKSRVETQAVSRLVRFCIEQRLDCARFSVLPAPTPLPPEPLAEFAGLGLVPREFPYRVSAQIALWRTAALRHYLVPGMSAWDFEHVGTQMAKRSEHRFFGPFASLVDYDHAIEKGKWKPEGLAICAAAGLPVVPQRSVFTDEQLQDHLQKGLAEYRASSLRAAAVNAFARGERLFGLRATAKYLRLRPLDPTMWGMGLLGLTGAAAFSAVEGAHLGRKLRAIRKRAVSRA
jgi:hypothetical protein